MFCKISYGTSPYYMTAEIFQKLNEIEDITKVQTNILYWNKEME